MPKRTPPLLKETVAQNVREYPAHVCAWYCRHPNFGRSEQEHKHKGNENKSAKYGLTAFKDQIKIHLRPGASKHLTNNHTVKELIKARVPRLPCCERFVPNPS